MRGQPAEVADGIGRELNRLLRLSAHVAAHSKHVGDRVTCLMLGNLCDGPRRSSALAEALHADPSTISRYVSQLVKDGLVARVVDPDDGRASLLAATDAGLRYLDELRQRRTVALTAVLDNWDDHDRRLLGTLLRRFVDDYETHLPELVSALTDIPPTALRGEK